MSETEVTTEAQTVITDDLDAFSADFFGQKQTETTPTKVEAEQDTETEAKQEDAEAQKTETETDADDETDAEAKAEAEKPKRKSAQDRIDELVRQREDAKREAKAELEALRREFEEYKASSAKPQKEVSEPLEPTPNDLKEDGTERYPLGEFDPQYIRDLTKFTLEQERKAAAAVEAEQRKVQEETRSRQALAAEWNQRVEASKASYPDFVEKGNALLSSFNHLEAGYADYLSTIFMSMEKGPDVLYYLSNHPEEAVSIVNSGAQKATLALGRIEAKFIEADALKQAAKPKVSKAPPPPPVQARGTNGAFIAVAPDTDDLDAFAQEFFKRKR